MTPWWRGNENYQEHALKTQPGAVIEPPLPKLQGLAHYAETHSQFYCRIEAVAETVGKLRVLDLTRADVRQAVKEATSTKGFYKGAMARIKVMVERILKKHGYPPGLQEEATKTVLAQRNYSLTFGQWLEKRTNLKK